MKRTKLFLVALITLFVVSSSTSNAQRFFYVDTEYILENIPEYKDAQQKLDQLSINWQKEIEIKYSEIEKLYKEFQAEQILLTEDMKRKRENEILEKEKAVKEFQKQKFGYEGELFRKKQELVKPIQDKIYNIIKKMASEQNYAVVFDKSSDLIFLYSNPRYDKSDDVLRKLGFRASTDDDADGSKSGGSGSPEKR
ncbi:MAG: OmpH family outer membrane protein [Bacteroidia bacterium]|nr:OmpH family outer membrane protein [Bacteroidia bacterium]NNC86736.1 OmpH family outer membrane protein [Bacteroidia bacterium]NNM15634.1 OmpH family outer membrane protein [Bacteroidia bacterium]